MKSTLTNEQLIAKAKQWVKELCESGGRKWSLRVPADHNHDPDLIFCELCNRLEEYAQQSQPSGMRWVRASERLPEDGITKNMKWFNGTSWQPCTGVYSQDRNRIMLCSGLKPVKNFKNIMWLDESSPAGAAEGIKCKCPDNIKHGQTSVMCCNHCGLPDEDFWNNCG